MYSSILIFLLFCASVAIASEKVVICYYGTWATYRWGTGKFDVATINPDLCTHLVYTFVGINSDGTVVSLDPYLDLADNWGRGNFDQFTALKNQNPKLKTILAVGGWNEGSAKYSIMASNAAYRQNFIQSALKMVQEHNFDGLDVDWEYPNQRDSVYGKSDIDNFTQLLKELKEEFEKHGLLVTAAVAAVESSASLSYDVAAISKHLDYISVMAYDMYGAWDAVTGYNAALHSWEGHESSDTLNTVDMAVKYWLEAGCPPEKLVLGVPFYGRTFSLTNPNEHTVRSPSSGSGIAGQYTATNGFIGYNEFCLKLQTESWTVHNDEKAKVPYAYKNYDWVSYDDSTSLATKVEYAMSYNLSGIMVWSIETDDFNGLCGGGDFPLLRTINKVLERNVTSSASVTSTTQNPSSESSSSSAGTTSSTSSSTASSSDSSSSTTSAPTSSTATPNSICIEEGFAANPEDCSSYYMCVLQSDGSLLAFMFPCPATLRWDQSQLYCNYPEYVNCKV